MAFSLSSFNAQVVLQRLTVLECEERKRLLSDDGLELAEGDYHGAKEVVEPLDDVHLADRVLTVCFLASSGASKRPSHGALIVLPLGLLPGPGVTFCLEKGANGGATANAVDILVSEVRDGHGRLGNGERGGNASSGGPICMSGMIIAECNISQG